MNLFCYFCVCVSLIYPCNGERTKDKMYEMIRGSSACFRRLNATHQTGCTSKRTGSTGVIHILENLNSTNLDFILKAGQAAPYMVVLPIDLLSRKILKQFKSSYPERIAGLIVHKNSSRPSKFSNDLKCPNENYGLSDSCDAHAPWNAAGTGILHEDYPFPVFLVENVNELGKIRDCFVKFNAHELPAQMSRSLCSLELASFMFATTNSETCLRRSNSGTNFTPPRFCDPLGDRNVWTTLVPWKQKKDVILVMARMDTTSFFDQITPGAQSPLTGLITLMTTAYLMKNYIKTIQLNDVDKNIFFILFNGESYDYIGSQRFVYDIINKQFPMEKDNNIEHQLPQLSLSDIQLIVDLGQFNHKKDLYTHHIEYNDDDSMIKNFTKLLKKYSSASNILINEAIPMGNHLPPSSLQSFLTENKQIKGFVLTDHNGTSFSNEFYNSIYDDEHNIRYRYYNSTFNSNIKIAEDSIQKYIANISTSLAKSLYETAFGVPYNGDDIIDASNMVDELFHCYLDTANCSLFQAITLKDHIDEKPLSLYVGVVENSNIITSLTGFSLAWLTGDRLNISQDNCTTDPQNPIYQFVWMSDSLITNQNASICFRTTMNFTLAVSPAFTVQDYDWKSNKYSSWTESVWKDLYVRMYLKPSQTHEIMTISVGASTFALSLAFVYFVKTRSNVLFAKSESQTSGTSC